METYMSIETQTVKKVKDLTEDCERLQVANETLQKELELLIMEKEALKNALRELQCQKI